ncbi:MAG: M23 family metallopeptidase [Treponema sp.]|nr:M23 family metallopeptidase [Treponema sp.]
MTHSARTSVFLLIFLIVPSSLALTAQTDDETPQNLTIVSKEDCIAIETPRFIPPRSAKTDEERETITQSNDIWQQYQKDIERYNKIKNLPKYYSAAKIRDEDKPRALFYTYTVQDDKDKYLNTFNGLYARLQQSQGAFATINHISHQDDIKTGITVILPIPQGLFIPKKADSTLEILLQKEYAALITEHTPLYEINGETFYFLRDKTFTQTQIAFFHDKGMQLPLSKKIVTSEFGYRTSPITGDWKLHAGIDLAAPIGTEVFACKSGTVSAVEQNHPLYGKYIDIRHNGNTTSRYAHLSKTLVTKGQTVSTGQTIGLVGTTGASTGPHLHFEVRENGTPTDPAKQIRNF